MAKTYARIEDVPDQDIKAWLDDDGDLLIAQGDDLVIVPSHDAHTFAAMLAAILQSARRKSPEVTQ